MSSIAPTTRLGWRLLPAVVAAAVAVIIASLLIATLREHPVVISRGRSSGAITGADVAEAAVWHTDSYPVGASGKLTKKQSAHFKHQKVRVRATVRDLADAISLDPGRLPRATARVMTAAAARSLLQAAPGMPKGAEAVTAIKRSGRVGIQAPGFSAAAAEIHITMQATIDDRLVTWKDTLTFWLTRAKGEWSVISFDLDRQQT